MEKDGSTANPFARKSYSAAELAVRVANEPELEAEFKKNPASALAAIAAPLQTDAWIYRIVVSALGLAVVLAVIGAVLLAALGNESPQILIALGSAAVGALAGLLAPSPSGKT